MSRLLAAACVVTLLVGCAKALSSFSDEASAGQSQSLEPTRTCGSARTPPLPRVPESGDYCLRRAAAATCIRRAELKLERCLRGEASRRECPGYVWRTRPPVPYEPVKGVTRAGLERSFTSLLSSTEYGDAALDTVCCASTRECVVTWQGDEATFSARFDVSGHRQRAGCWIAERNLRLSDLLPNRLRACVDWEWNR